MAQVLCVGVGHVGLPLSLKLWDAGNDVALVDVDETKISSLRAGRMPFHEIGCDDLLGRAFDACNFVPLTYADANFVEMVRAAEYVVMTLGTPLGTDYTFRFDQYFDVLSRMTRHLRQGVTLVVRSTVAPHFTRNVVTARIASERDWVPGVDFFPSFCPERLVQGQAIADIDDLPEIIGADDEATATKASALFLGLNPAKRCMHVSTVEAELAKLFLNTYRYTMFGLANEFAQVAEQYGADVFSILDAANANYPRGGIPLPGPSRGPCLGKDTATLAFSTTAGLIAHAAIKSNENVVLHAARELREAVRTFAGRRIAILGLAFKADSDDTRDNLTLPFVNLLDREGATTCIYDPHVRGYDDPAVLEGCDAVVLMTCHTAFKLLSESDLVALCKRSRDEFFVLDLWNAWTWADRTYGKGNDDFYEDSGHGRLRVAHARSDAPSGASGSRRSWR
ncbi:MAG: nucleotide sugar dehydrogenase [Chloroflexota bacterium]